MSRCQGGYSGLCLPLVGRERIPDSLSHGSTLWLAAVFPQWLFSGLEPWLQTTSVFVFILFQIFFGNQNTEKYKKAGWEGRLFRGPDCLGSFQGTLAGGFLFAKGFPCTAPRQDNRWSQYCRRENTFSIRQCPSLQPGKLQGLAGSPSAP